MKKSLHLVGLLAAVLIFAGCGDSGFTLTKQERAAFNSATPEVKQLWEDALKADKANDYLTAGEKFRALLTNNISADQLVAVQTALGAFNIRLNDAAAKGDAAAQKALESAKAAAPRR